MAIDTGYGIDTTVRAGPDQDQLDQTFAEISSVQVLLEDVYKAVTTSSTLIQDVDGVPSPIMFWENPQVSFDIRDYLLDSIDASTALQLTTRIEAIYEQDPRFSSVSATVNFDAPSGVLSVPITAVAVTGKIFRLVITVDSNNVTVEEVT